MLSDDFERELIDLIGNAIDGTMVKPEWVMSFIRPVIAKRLMEQKIEHINSVGELVRAARGVLRFRGQIGNYPRLIEETENIPKSALDRLGEAVQKIRQGILSESENSDNQHES